MPPYLAVAPRNSLDWLRLALAAVFCAIMLLLLLLLLPAAAVAVALLHFEVVRPLTELLYLAHTVRSGSFVVRVAVTGPDEMGPLGQAFLTGVPVRFDGRAVGSAVRLAGEAGGREGRRSRAQESLARPAVRSHQAALRKNAGAGHAARCWTA